MCVFWHQREISRIKKTNKKFAMANYWNGRISNSGIVHIKLLVKPLSTYGNFPLNNMCWVGSEWSHFLDTGQRKNQSPFSSINIQKFHHRTFVTITSMFHWTFQELSIHHTCSNKNLNWFILFSEEMWKWKIDYSELKQRFC